MEAPHMQAATDALAALQVRLSQHLCSAQSALQEAALGIVTAAAAVLPTSCLGTVWEIKMGHPAHLLRALHVRHRYHAQKVLDFDSRARWLCS